MRLLRVISRQSNVARSTAPRPFTSTVSEPNSADNKRPISAVAARIMLPAPDFALRPSYDLQHIMGQGGKPLVGSLIQPSDFAIEQPDFHVLAIDELPGQFQRVFVGCGLDRLVRRHAV